MLFMMNHIVNLLFITVKRMNDFTKEELESIITTIKSLRVYTEIENWDEDLLEKIQSMIDNYCEHENDIRFNAYPVDGSIKMCTKCQGFYI